MSYHSQLKQRLYFSLPYPLKCATATAYGMGQRRTRYGQVFRTTMAELQETQYADQKAIQDYASEWIGKFLASAIERTPYYRSHDAYRGAGSLAELHTLPVLEKTVVQDNLKSFYADGFQDSPHQWGHTSGTTGKALVFPITDACFQREYAFRTLHYSWGGVDLVNRERVAFCSGHPVAYRDRTRPPFWTWDGANNWLLLSSYHLTQSTVESYVRKLESFQPVMLGGYPSSLYILALAYRQHGRGKLELRSAFTASEMLFEHQRRAIEEAFNVRVFDWYGNSELCGHITECEQGQLHVRHEHSLLEVLNTKNERCRVGETGQLVATGFHNTAFPLIRYRVGDEVTLATETSCPCGRTGTLIDRIDGRNEDYILTPDGRFVGRLDHLFKDTVGVREAQLEQHKLEEVTLRIVKSPEFTKQDEETIMRQARLRMGSTIRITVDYVESIPRTGSGKFPFIVSHLDTTSAIDTAFSNSTS